MLVSDYYKKIGGDFQQYILEGQTIVEWTTGPLKNNLTNSYKDFLVFHNTPNRGEIFKNNMPNYIQERINKFGNPI